MKTQETGKPWINKEMVKKMEEKKDKNRERSENVSKVEERAKENIR